MPHKERTVDESAKQCFGVLKFINVKPPMCLNFSRPVCCRFACVAKEGFASPLRMHVTRAHAGNLQLYSYSTLNKGLSAEKENFRKRNQRARCFCRPVQKGKRSERGKLTPVSLLCLLVGIQRTPCGENAQSPNLGTTAWNGNHKIITHWMKFDLFFGNAERIIFCCEPYGLSMLHSLKNSLFWQLEHERNITQCRFAAWLSTG